VSDQPQNFGPLLSQDPSITPTFVSTKNYTPGKEDVVLFDEFSPVALPKTPALFVSKSGKVAGLDALEPGTPLLAGVDLSTLAVDAPTVAVMNTPGRRAAVFGFSVRESKAMFAPAFPVLLANAIDWLAHPVPNGTRRPGPAVFAGQLGSIVGPDGKPVVATRIGDSTVVPLARVGFYSFSSGGATSVVAVNAGDPAISDLRHTTLRDSASNVSTAQLSKGRPWWLLAAFAALLLIAAEWFTWQRRITV
jgi:hypothetical protein